MSADLHGSNSLEELRCLSEFYAVIHFLDLFKLTSMFPNFSIDKLESAIIDDGAYLIDIIIKLLKCISRKQINYDTWEKTLQLLLKSRIHEYGGVNPLDSSSFHDLPIKDKAKILLALCDWQLDDNPTLRDMLADNSMIPKMRLSAVGKDRDENPYYYFEIGGTTRLCREVPCTTTTDPLLIIASKAGRRSKDDLYESPNPYSWETVASTLPEFQDFAVTLQNSKHKGEVALLTLVNNNYIPALLAKEKNQQMAQKRLQRLDVSTTNIISSGRARKSIKYSSFFEENDHDDE